VTEGFLIKGILIGLFFGIPVGAVGTLTVQRAYRHGFASGIKTGLGSSFAIGITNLAAVLTFLFAFSYFGITGETGFFQGIQLVAGVFIGTFLWWWILSAGVVFLRKKVVHGSFRYMNQIFGTILTLFGIVIFVRAIF